MKQSEYGAVRIDCAFPGGNILIDRIEGDAVFVHQDLRETSGDWFYWCFRVRGAAGRTLSFHFTKSNVIGVRGPAFSADGGSTWKWLGKDSVEGASFVYTFPPDADEVRFSLGMPYQEANLTEFIRRHTDHPGLKVERLCRTGKGRRVERLHLGCLHGKAAYRVLLTCRHHCCEMMASYALEGIMKMVLSDTEEGRWFGENVEFLVVPFVDKDGVEDGDQGKNRTPHDHNRDYGEPCIYPSVQALRAFIPRWSEGRLRVALDLHCPWIRGPKNEVIYLVGSQSKEIWREQGRFSGMLESVQRGPLVFDAKDNLPFGRGWNTNENFATGKSCSRWTGELPGIRLASSIEIPYANADAKEVNPESAKAFGYDVGRALCVYLKNKTFAATPR
jgi:hypothetical protein